MPNERLGLGDHWPVPQRRILLGKRNVFAVPVAPLIDAARSTSR
jgi:hypothetical protein